MEHRWHTRKKITLDVQLIQRDLLKFNAKTINISLGGMFVETDSTGIEEKASLEVMLSQRSNTKINRYCIKAYVIYKNEKGVGLMFYSQEPAVSNMLYQILDGNCNTEYKATTIYDNAGPLHSSAKINQ
jgi:hypothetical protein